MHFLSPGMLLWMAGTVSVFWLLPAAWRTRALSALTLAFLGIYAPESALVLVALTLATWFTASRAGHEPAAVAAVCFGIIALLAVYKLGLRVSSADAPGDVIVPLGLSYYTLRCVHYAFDRFKGILREHSFEQFVAYLFFLPTIVAGPIHRFGDFHRDLRRHHWNGSQLARGLERILYGYAKISILGNFLVSTKFAALLADVDPSREALLAYLDCLRYGMNLYFQFAGYSDVAIGFGMLLGFQVMENFDFPFLRKNISEFWKSWHISLSSWCRDYVYMVVWSNTRMRALAVVASMIVLGLWHEITWRYLVWGFYHGAGIVVWNSFQTAKRRLPQVRNPLAQRALTVGSVLLTLNFVLLSFAITKEPDLAAGLEVYRALFLSWL